MADVELVIKIDEKLYKDIFSDAEIIIYSGMRSGKTLLATLLRAIRNGTPLPKGHGRLIDADALEKEIVNGIKAGNYEEGYETFAHINDMDDCLECVKYADTIIEADKDCRECKVEHDCYECEKYAESEE